MKKIDPHYLNRKAAFLYAVMIASREGKPKHDELGKVYRRGRATWGERKHVDGFGLVEKAFEYSVP